MKAEIDPRRFVALVQPCLERHDLPGLLALLKEHWCPEQILHLLRCDCSDARKVAILACGLVAPACACPALAEQLKDPDPVVNQLAEHALWSIWFRAGTPAANHELCRGSQAMDRRELGHAIEHFDRAIEIDPSLAEAYNQRAMARFILEGYDEAIADCRMALERMPCHFGAWAGMGHGHAHLGRLPKAVMCYEKALAINPHLKDIEEAACALRAAI